MADAGEIAALFATLGLKVNAGEWSKGTTQIRQMQTALGQLSTGAGALGKVLGGAAGAAESAGQRASGAFSGFGATLTSTVKRAEVLGLSLGGVFAYLGQRMVRSGVELNATLEESKNQIAGMMALTKKTHLAEEMGNANTLVDNLERRAAKLPGTTAEYVKMLSNITKPIFDAKLGMQDLEDITVNSVIAAKAFGVAADVAARDVDQALRGQYHSVDPFSSKVLGSVGYSGEEGRARYNALSDAKRASEFKRALAAPQIAELGEAQGKSFTGIVSTMMDAWEQFEKRVTKPIFEKLGEQITKLNAWFDENKVKVMEVADKIGGALLFAFEAVGKAIKFFAEHADLTIAILTSIGIVLAGLAVAWIAGFWPIFAVIAAVTALVSLFRKLLDYPGGIKQAFSDAFNAVKEAIADVADAIVSGFSDAFDAVADLPPIKALTALVDKVEKLVGWHAPSVETAKGIMDKSVPAKVMLNDLDTMAPEDFRKRYPWLPHVEGGGRHMGTGDPELRPDRAFTPIAPASSGSAGGTTVHVGGVSMGDIHVNAPNADPVAVGDQVRKVFHEELGNTLRKTMDVYG